MKLALVGSKYFGATVLAALQKEDGVQIACVVAPAADDRLALAAHKAGIPVHVQTNPKIVPGEAIADGVDLLVAAHTHARVSDEALARTRLGGVGYHPSLLPRHRGIAAVEWTILSGDPIAGGSVYHLADGWDKGAVAMQDWCFVAKNDDARSLWERALAPMGLALLCKVVQHARAHGALPAFTQDEQFATKAPMIRRAVTLTEGQTGGQIDGQAGGASTATTLVVTVMGADRPGIVSLLSDRAQRFGANWAVSRMAHLAGEFAGMVQLEVPPENADGLAKALRDLASTGLQVVISKSAGAAFNATSSSVTLELVGDDRVGIVSKLTTMLAARNVSIEHIDTEVLAANPGGKPAFKVRAQLQVPKTQAMDDLRSELGTLAQELMMDLNLGD